MPFCLEKKGLFVFVIELGEMFFFLTVISCMPTGSFEKYYISHLASFHNVDLFQKAFRNQSFNFFKNAESY